MYLPLLVWLAPFANPYEQDELSQLVDYLNFKLTFQVKQGHIYGHRLDIGPNAAMHRAEMLASAGIGSPFGQGFYQQRWTHSR